MFCFATCLMVLDFSLLALDQSVIGHLYGFVGQTQLQSLVTIKQMLFLLQRIAIIIFLLAQFFCLISQIFKRHVKNPFTSILLLFFFLVTHLLNMKLYCQIQFHFHAVSPHMTNILIDSSSAIFICATYLTQKQSYIRDTAFSLQHRNWRDKCEENQYENPESNLSSHVTLFASQTKHLFNHR